MKQVPRVEYTDVNKHIELPVFEAQERIVEIPFVIEQALVLTAGSQGPALFVIYSTMSKI